MKRILMSVIAVVFTVSIMGADGQDGCTPAKTSNDVQREQQNTLLDEGTKQVGMPNIVNFRERKLLKMILEMRDQENFTSYTYLWSDYQGKYMFFCNSIGYGIPYATQFTAPETVQRWKISQGLYGVKLMPQADPNGLFSPASADGTWVLCKNPHGPDVAPVLVEPRMIVSPFKLEG